jgi:hypothetical protein
MSGIGMHHEPLKIAFDNDDPIVEALKKKHKPIPRLDNFSANDRVGYMLNKRYWARRGIKWPFKGE